MGGGQTSFDSCLNKLPISTFFRSFASHLSKLDLSATCIYTYFSHSAVAAVSDGCNDDKKGGGGHGKEKVPDHARVSGKEGLEARKWWMERSSCVSSDCA